MRPKQLKKFLISVIEAGQKGLPTTPVVVRGKPGTGKSEIIYQSAFEAAALKDKEGLEKLDLIVREPVDIGGMPYPSKDGKVLQFLEPDWSARLNEYYERTKKVSVLFLDDLGAAMPATQIAGLRLVREGECGASHLPPKCVRIAATNSASDKTLHNKMASPLANRFTWVSLESNFEDYCEYAISHNVDPRIVAFHRHFAGSKLYTDPVNDGPFSSPRSWSMLSDQLRIVNDVPDSMLEIIHGTVGEGPGTEFMAYIKIYEKLMSVDDILSGRTNAFPSQPDQAYAITSALAQRYLNEPKKHAERILDYVLHIPNEEFGVVLMRDCIRGYSQLHKDETNPITQVKQFPQWVNKYGKFVLADPF